MGAAFGEKVFFFKHPAPGNFGLECHPLADPTVTRGVSFKLRRNISDGKG
jgi:hypothetical protein